METQLSVALSQFFPSNGHVKEVCRPGVGKETCRFLVFSGRGFGCAKYTSLRRLIDERKDTMNAQGDNCEGILKIIIEHAPELLGKKVSYGESMPNYRSEGPLREIKIKDGMLSIAWDVSGREEYAAFAVTALGISISCFGIEFSLTGPGSFGGEVAISLN